jgi:hypothetical protein
VIVRPWFDWAEQSYAPRIKYCGVGHESASLLPLLEDGPSQPHKYKPDWLFPQEGAADKAPTDVIADNIPSEIPDDDRKCGLVRDADCRCCTRDSYNGNLGVTQLGDNLLSTG